MFRRWLNQLGESSGVEISSYPSFCDAVNVRLDAFQALGCRLADHTLDDFSYVNGSPAEVALLFEQVPRGDRLNASQNAVLRSGLLRQLGIEYHRRGWILQLHLAWTFPPWRSSVARLPLTAWLARCNSDPPGGLTIMRSACGRSWRRSRITACFQPSLA